MRDGMVGERQKAFLYKREHILDHHKTSIELANSNTDARERTCRYLATSEVYEASKVRGS